MKFNKNMSQILHVGWGNPECMDRLRNERLKNSPETWDLRQAEHESAVLWQPRGPTLSWGASGTNQAKEGIAMLCSDLGKPHIECWGLVWVPQ